MRRHHFRNVRSGAAALFLSTGLLAAPALAPPTPATFATIAGLAGTTGALHAQDVPDGPGDPVGHFRTLHRADSLYAAESFAEAGRLYREVFEADPRNGRARFRWARGLFEEGEMEGALELLEQSIAGGWVSESDVAVDVARALAVTGRNDDALRWARRAVESGTEDRPELKGDAFSALHDDPEFRRIAGMPPAGAEPDRNERWRRDLEFLREEARRLHASPEQPAHEPAWNRRVDDLKAEVGELTDTEIAVRIQGLLAALGDGHTVFDPSSAAELGVRSMPLRFYFFTDGLFVVDADEPHRRLVGRRVVAMGGRSVEGILDDLRPWVTRDNRWGLLWVGPLYLGNPAFLHAMGYAAGPDRAVLTLEDVEGGREDVTVEANTSMANLKLGPPPGMPPNVVPRWLERVPDFHWHEALPERDAVYAQLNQIRDEDDGTLADFALAVRESLGAGDHRHLILDLRHNNGGNNFLIWPLVRTVMHHEADDPGNRTWVIVGRNTFSAAQNLVNFLERETDAVFVGEPSSSKPNFTGETSSVELPYSGFRASISSRYWQDSYYGDDRPWIPVDLPVSLSSDDYFGGRDPVLETLFEVLVEE